MKKQIYAAAAIIMIVMLAAAGCAPDTNPYQETPDTAAPEPTPTPIPVREPVTRTDIPSGFMPGIASVGIVPEGTYKIGFIANAADGDSAWQNALRAVSDAYKELDIDVVTEIARDAQYQIDIVREMMGDIDFLILSPFDDALTEIGALCEAKGIPYITINSHNGGAPGEDGYVCTIERDDYMAGVLTGISIVQAMTDKYGTPRGNIGEITGVVSDPASMYKSMGIRRVFAEYEGLSVVCSVAGDDDADTSYKAAVNVLKAYGQDVLDGIITFSDEAGIQTIQACLDYDRSDMAGQIWSMGGTKEGLTCVWYGDFAQTVECTAQTGMAALEYALQYLEGQGDDIPSVVPTVTRVFSAETDEQAETVAAIIAEMDDVGTDVCFENMGSYDLFMLPQSLSDVYPRHYYEYDDVQGYLDEFEPYTTGKAIYNNTMEENEDMQ